MYAFSRNQKKAIPIFRINSEQCRKIFRNFYVHINILCRTVLNIYVKETLTHILFTLILLSIEKYTHGT